LTESLTGAGGRRAGRGIERNSELSVGMVWNCRLFLAIPMGKLRDCLDGTGEAGGQAVLHDDDEATWRQSVYMNVVKYVNYDDDDGGAAAA
jgi:outer membrane biogenesis lipoprotein LolB